MQEENIYLKESTK